MPIIAGAKKALRQSVKNKAKNDYFRELYREKRVAFEKAVKENDGKTAKEIYQNKKDKDGKNISTWLQASIDKLAKKNIIKKQTAARKKAKYIKMIKAIS